MDNFIVAAALEAFFGAVVKAIKDEWQRSKQFKTLLEQLKSTLDCMTPIFEYIESQDRADWTKALAEKLNQGEKLVLKCAGVHWWNKSSYAKKLIEYDTSLTRFFQIDVTAQILHSVRRVEGNLAGERPEKKKPAPFDGQKKEAAPPTARALPAPAPHPLDSLRNSPQFLALIPLLKENRHILKLTLQGLRKKRPDIFGSIKERKDGFLRLIYGPVDDIAKLVEDNKDLFEEDGSDGDLTDQPAPEMPQASNVSRAEQETPHTISVVLAEQEAIKRLVEMGFDSNLVIEAFLGCDGNEELAVNYLLANAGYFED